MLSWVAVGHWDKKQKKQFSLIYPQETVPEVVLWFVQVVLWISVVLLGSFLDRRGFYVANLPTNQTFKIKHAKCYVALVFFQHLWAQSNLGVKLLLRKLSSILNAFHLWISFVMVECWSLNWSKASTYTWMLQTNAQNIYWWSVHPGLMISSIWQQMTSLSSKINNDLVKKAVVVHRMLHFLKEPLRWENVYQNMYLVSRKIRFILFTWM